MAESLTVRCAALLFDMDGVLVDSTRAVTRVWSAWARERGFDPHYVSHIAHGRPSITTVRELLPKADAEAENREVERREIADLEGVVACAGAPELLASLPPERWALVTSSTRPLAVARLRAAGLAQPRNFITSSDIVNGKPHPEPYLKAAKMLGVEAAQCVVVEDVPAGIKAGKAAGAQVIALRTTMSEDVLLAAEPDWVVDSCAAIRVMKAEASGLEIALAIGEKAS